MDLLQKFQQYIQKEHLFQPKDKLLIAVSGGVDSAVLCKLCKEAGYDFVMAHCNFQLRGEYSLRDERFVKELAQEYGVAFYLKTFNTIEYAAVTKKSMEEAARDLRYDWFRTLLNDSKVAVGEREGSGPLNLTYILTGHHADD
ncbi:MAG: ATP-binding protein, partial [Ferruginibacter sp.]